LALTKIGFYSWRSCVLHVAKVSPLFSKDFAITASWHLSLVYISQSWEHHYVSGMYKRLKFLQQLSNSRAWLFYLLIIFQEILSVTLADWNLQLGCKSLFSYLIFLHHCKYCLNAALDVYYEFHMWLCFPVFFCYRCPLRADKVKERVKEDRGIFESWQ